MKLNKIEFFLMNNWIRNLIQEHVETKRLRRFSTLAKDKTVLEIGCGSGNGSRLIKKYFSPRKIHATDLDEKMIAIAKRKNKDNAIEFSVQSATELKFRKNQFDAVFDYGILHHIPNWKDALVELQRVVKPGGELILEDLSIETFQTPFGRLLKKTLDHPYESMYTREEFVAYLETLGFEVKTYKLYSFLIHYFVVIARKKNPQSKKKQNKKKEYGKKK